MATFLSYGPWKAKQPTKVFSYIGRKVRKVGKPTDVKKSELQVGNCKDRSIKAAAEGEVNNQSRSNRACRFIT